MYNPEINPYSWVNLTNVLWYATTLPFENLYLVGIYADALSGSSNLSELDLPSEM